MSGEIIDRHFNRMPPPKLFQMLHQKASLQSIWVVEIDFGPLFGREVTAIPVIGIVLNISDLITPDPIQDSLRDRRLARTCTPGHTDDNWFASAMSHSIALPGSEPLPLLPPLHHLCRSYVIQDAVSIFIAFNRWASC
jgi:hypothetical protein